MPPAERIYSRSRSWVGWRRCRGRRGGFWRHARVVAPVVSSDSDVARGWRRSVSACRPRTWRSCFCRRTAAERGASMWLRSSSSMSRWLPPATPPSGTPTSSSACSRTGRLTYRITSALSPTVDSVPMADLCVDVLRSCPIYIRDIWAMVLSPVTHRCRLVFDRQRHHWKMTIEYGYYSLPGDFPSSCHATATVAKPVNTVRHFHTQLTSKHAMCRPPTREYHIACCVPQNERLKSGRTL